MGKPKAEVAAQRIEERVAGVTVTPHFCRIEEKPLDFYEQFHIIVLGLDSLEARRYMNQVACSFLGRHSTAAQQFACIVWAHVVLSPAQALHAWSANPCSLLDY